MCGIIGIFNSEKAFEQIKIGLELLQERGKDGLGIASEIEASYGKTISSLNIKESNNLVGHTLHSVVDYVPQPILNKNKKSLLVANCELYNWQELAQKYRLKVNNDAELLLAFLDKFGLKKISELDGVYAFAYWKNDILYLARDILGEKPLWFSDNKEKKQFAFASEKKVLKKLNYQNVQELNPRHLLTYNLKTKKITFQYRKFLISLPEHKLPYEKVKEKTKQLLSEAIEKRIPKQKFGLLFSGGVDSTYLAQYLKLKGYDFTCYTAVFDLGDNSHLQASQVQALPSDLYYAQKAAQELGLNLKVAKVKLTEIPSYLKKVIPLIEDSNPIKVSVALTFYLACELAKKDGCKVIFSGTGSEEIFAGYERHKRSSNINQECLSGLLKIYERDLYRDDVLTMANNLELRLPFLDQKLVAFALKIPQQYKINEKESKLLLRQLALELGLPEDLAFRKKVAAQYGSRLDYALERLTKLSKCASRGEYLKKFYPEPNLKLGVLFSSGKDSTYAAHIMRKQNYELTCLITIKSENPASYMFHTPAIEMAQLQAEAMALPIIFKTTKGEKEKELSDLKKALLEAKEKFQIEGIVTGALYSTYQRDRIELLCDQLGLKIFAPLWYKEQELEMQELLGNGFKFIFTAIAAEGLDATWLNKIITIKELEKLKQLKAKFGLNPSGEGGEFESLVLDCPLFKKKIVLDEVEVVVESKNTAHVVIKKARLQEK